MQFYTNVEEAVGSDDSLITFSQTLFDLSNAKNKTDAAKLYAYLTNPNTVATVFAPTDDVSALGCTTPQRAACSLNSSVPGLHGNVKRIALSLVSAATA